MVFQIIFTNNHFCRAKTTLEMFFNTSHNNKSKKKSKNLVETY